MATARQQGAKPGEWTILSSRYSGRCGLCQIQYNPGDDILYRKGHTPRCAPECTSGGKAQGWAEKTREEFEEIMENHEFYDK